MNHPSLNSVMYSLGHPIIQTLHVALAQWVAQNTTPSELLERAKSALRHHIREVVDQNNLSTFRDMAREDDRLDEGVLEVDDNALVSYAGDDAGGAYVQAWLWVDNSDLPADVIDMTDEPVLGHKLSDTYITLIRDILKEPRYGLAGRESLIEAAAAHDAEVANQKKLQAYRDVASEHSLISEGSLELDDGACVSFHKNSEEGAYVQVWLWVDADDEDYSETDGTGSDE